MNNTFNFTRFKKVLARDFRATYKRFGLAALILSLLVVTVWITNLVTGIPSYYTDPDWGWGMESFYQGIIGERVTIILLGVVISFAIAPAIIYKSCNLKGRGNYYAMLPASHLEKYLSMLFYCCIFAPIVVFLGSLIVDTLLTLLPIGYFKYFIWNYDEWYYIDAEFVLRFIAFLFLTASIFMFSNTLFKRAKFIKTVLWLMLIGFLLLLTSIAFPALFRLFVSFLPAFIILLVSSLILQIFTFRRLKKMQY